MHIRKLTLFQTLPKILIQILIPFFKEKQSRFTSPTKLKRLSASPAIPNLDLSSKNAKKFVFQVYYEMFRSENCEYRCNRSCEGAR